MNPEHMSLTQLRRELDRLRAFRSPSTADLRRENRVALRIVELERTERRARPIQIAEHVAYGRQLFEGGAGR